GRAAGRGDPGRRPGRGVVAPAPGRADRGQGLRCLQGRPGVPDPVPARDLPDQDQHRLRRTVRAATRLRRVPTPEYISRLRTKIGNDLLLLPGVSGVIVDGEPGAERVLLGRRSDNGRWASPGGIVEPGEHPAACIVREIAEEVSVEARVDRLVLVTTAPPVTYPNGDR